MELENLLALRLIAETNEAYVKEKACYTLARLDEEIENHSDFKTIETEQQRLVELNEVINSNTLNADELEEYKDAVVDCERRIAFYQNLVNEVAPANALKIASLISEENINEVNSNGIFKIELDTITNLRMSLIGTVSKAVFKQLVELSGEKRFNKDNFSVKIHNYELIEEVIRKSTKISQTKLQTILKCRLDGLYKGKFKNGKTWNKGGIDKA